MPFDELREKFVRLSADKQSAISNLSNQTISDFRKSITTFEEISFLQLARMVYEEIGIIADEDFFKQNIREPLRTVYPESMAESTFKFMLVNIEHAKDILKEDIEFEEFCQGAQKITECLQEDKIDAIAELTPIEDLLKNILNVSEDSINSSKSLYNSIENENVNINVSNVILQSILTRSELKEDDILQFLSSVLNKCNSEEEKDEIFDKVARYLRILREEKAFSEMSNSEECMQK